jgi:deazaflavin-dependent oxidoreductase (nitroreductase family)
VSDPADPAPQKAAEDLAELDFAYLTTTGRITGAPHEIEIWFALEGETVYLLSGGGDRSDWVRNLMVSPSVSLRIGDVKVSTRARVVTADTEEDALARRSLVDKYRARDRTDLSDWGRMSLPIAVDWPRGQEA